MDVFAKIYSKFTETIKTRSLVEPGDTVVVALGRKPRREEADGLRFCAPEFIQLGDCDSPATIWQATETAYHMLTDI